MTLIETAIRVATEAHDGQMDADGQLFILHPLRVMDLVEGDNAKVVAVLHDVLHRTEIDEEDLRREGFEDAILEAIRNLTQWESEPYTSYILRCRSNELARRVKLADLEDDLRPRRFVLLPEPPDRAIVSMRRYYLSYKYLTGLMTDEHFMALMGGVHTAAV